MRRRDAGMTLVEMLVAVTLLAMLGTVIATGTRIGGRAWGSAERQTNEIDDIDTVQSLLRRTIARAQPAFASADPNDRRIAFAGEPNALALVMPQPGTGEAGPWVRLRLHVMQRGAARALMLSWQVDAPTTSAATERDALLLDHVAALTLSYFGAAAPGEAASWQDRWVNADRLPTLVRIGIRRAGDGLRPWPDIVAATRITANAGCIQSATSTACSRGAR